MRLSVSRHRVAVGWPASPRRLAAPILVVLVLAAAGPAGAFTDKFFLTHDVWIQFGLLGQFMYEAKEANAGHLDPQESERDAWSNEFFVRRLRMIAQGAVTDWLRFYISSDSPNLGKHRNENDIFVNDAMLELNLAPQARIVVGRILAPFSFENLQGAGTVLGVDYNLNALKLPQYIDAAYRDDGVEVTGVVAKQWIEYRGGLFAGSRHDDATGDGPRVTGRVMLNLADPQNGWFYFENGLGTKTTSSIGVGFDYQERGGPEAKRNYQAWVVDGVVDRQIGSSGQVLSLAAAYYGWRHGSGDFTGHTASAQAGWLLWKKLQPVVRWERQAPDHASDLDTWHVGLNFYLKGYNANVKADWALGDRRDTAGHYESAVRAQVQFFY